MKIGVVYEKIMDRNFPQGFYYAHIPTLGLTTHGKGIDGAKTAIYDLLKIWIDEKLQNGEEILFPEEQLYSIN